MKRIQSNQFNMGGVVLEGLDKKSAIWSGNALAVGKRNELEARLTEIGKADETQQKNRTKGERATKKGAKRKLTEAAVVVANGICARATDIGDAKTFAEFDKARSEIYEMKDVDCLAFCKLVKGYADAHAAALVDYNISAGVAGALGGAITVFDAVRSGPVNARGRFHGATEGMVNGLKGMFKVLHWWDMFVGSLRRSEADLYIAYRVWRKVHRTGVRRVSIVGLVVSEAGLTPLYRVKVRVEGHGEAVFSSKRGRFRVFSLQPGVYSLVVEAEGYETQKVEQVAVRNGEMVRVEVRMRGLGN